MQSNNNHNQESIKDKIITTVKVVLFFVALLAIYGLADYLCPTTGSNAKEYCYNNVNIAEDNNV